MSKTDELEVLKVELAGVRDWLDIERLELHRLDEAYTDARRTSSALGKLQVDQAIRVKDLLKKEEIALTDFMDMYLEVYPNPVVLT